MSGEKETFTCKLVKKNNSKNQTFLSQPLPVLFKYFPKSKNSENAKLVTIKLFLKLYIGFSIRTFKNTRNVLVVIDETDEYTKTSYPTTKNDEI